MKEFVPHFTKTFLFRGCNILYHIRFVCGSITYYTYFIFPKFNSMRNQFPLYILISNSNICSLFSCLCCKNNNSNRFKIMGRRGFIYVNHGMKLFLISVFSHDKGFVSRSIFIKFSETKTILIRRAFMWIIFSQAFGF